MSAEELIAPADATAVARLLDATWPEARCALQARDPWELLVAAVLSARCADERVNQVMAVLNEHFVAPRAYADLDPRVLEGLLRRLPLYRQKARALVEAARWICYHHGGEVPADWDTLATLPGVGRKTAAVVAGNAFGQPTIAADVHVQRLARRFGWCPRRDAVAAEAALAERFAPETWVRRCHQLIRLGRELCRPRRPWCSRCPLSGTCPKVGVDDAR